tara:strand:- start:19507 stop:20106 length:600 start_codon:yes stop_codon:yes gene_type:complete
MKSNLKIANTKIEGEWSSIISKLDKCTFFSCDDYDLKNAVSGVAIKSETGNINDLLRTKEPEVPEDYSLTILYKHPTIKKLIDLFELQTTRIRIFKQAPGSYTPLHVDYNNTKAKSQKDFLIRIWTAITEDELFEYYFMENGKEIKISLKQGESVVFNPDKVYHGAANKSSNIRYSLNIIGYPNDWLKKFIKDERVYTL